jgi:hypothetical protein
MAIPLDRHDWKWYSLNGMLLRIGYSVIWERMIDQDQCRYAIRKGKYAGMELLGIYHNEAEAEAMCNLLLSQAKYEEE